MLVDKKGYQGIIKQLSSVMVKFIFYEGKGGCCYAHISYSDKTSVGFSDTNITIKPCEPLKLHTSYRRLFTYWINVHSLRGTQMHSNVEHIGKQQFKL